jgi:hypothetical protein
MLCTILRPMQAAMTGHEFQNFMGTFLWYAADLPGFPLGKVYNYAWSAGTTIASIVALVLLWNDRGSTSFVLTAIGLGIVIVGMPIVSNVWKTPTYNLIVLGPIGYASGLAALFHDQLDPTGGDLGGVRRVHFGSELPLAGVRAYP